MSWYRIEDSAPGVVDTAEWGDQIDRVAAAKAARFGGRQCLAMRCVAAARLIFSRLPAIRLDPNR